MLRRGAPVMRTQAFLLYSGLLASPSHAVGPILSLPLFGCISHLRLSSFCSFSVWWDGWGARQAGGWGLPHGGEVPGFHSGAKGDLGIVGWSRLRLRLCWHTGRPHRLDVLGPWFHLWVHLRATGRSFFKTRMLAWSDESFWK